MADRKTTPGGDVHNRNAYYHDEGDGTSDEAHAAHLRGWDTGNLRWTRIATNSTTGALLVEATVATGDIEIGAVEIKNATDDTRAKVVTAAPSGTDAGLVVHVASQPAGSSGLTNTELRASAVPVSLATLPALVAGTANIGDVDVLTVPAPLSTTGTGTEATALRVTLATDSTGLVSVDDNGGSLTVDAPVGTPLWVRESDGAAALVGQKAMAASKPVVIASDQTVIPVSDNAGSLTVDAPVGTPAFARLSDGAAALIGQKAMASSLPVTVASDQATFPVTATGPTLTKGTQGATGYSVQDLKDSGRVNIALTIEFAFAQTAETLLTVTESRAGAATGTFTSKTITSGKRIRFTGGFAIIETLGTGTTVPQRMYLRLRVNTAGATIASSPLQYVFGLGISTGSAAIPVKSSNCNPIVIPDGVEYAGDGTATYGLTLETPDWVITTGTGRCKITLFAFEY